MSIYDVNGNIIPTGGSESGSESHDYFVKTVNHRGWTKNGACENTIDAFNGSVAQGYLYVETDIRLTSDGVWVLLHDESINRIAYNSDGSAIENTVNIADITYEQALTYKFGSGSHATTIATLKEFAEWCLVHSIHPYVEIKAGNQTTIAEAYEICQKAGISRNMSWISPTMSYLGHIVALDPFARFGFLYNTSAYISQMETLKTNYNRPFISQSFQGFSVEGAKAVLDAGMELEIWTLDRLNSLSGIGDYKAVLKWCVQNGCTGVTTDDIHAQQILLADQ